MQQARPYEQVLDFGFGSQWLVLGQPEHQYAVEGQALDNYEIRWLFEWPMLGNPPLYHGREETSHQLFLLASAECDGFVWNGHEVGFAPSFGFAHQGNYGIVSDTAGTGICTHLFADRQQDTYQIPIQPIPSYFAHPRKSKRDASARYRARHRARKKEKESKRLHSLNCGTKLSASTAFELHT